MSVNEDAAAIVAAIDRLSGEVTATNRRLEALVTLVQGWDRPFRTQDGRDLHQLQVIARTYAGDR